MSENEVLFQNLIFQHIEQVTGYVLISRFSGNLIDFSSLRLIRGNELYLDPPEACKGTAGRALNQSSLAANVREYALRVVSNSGFNGNGLKELWLPNLTGITINPEIHQPILGRFLLNCAFSFCFILLLKNRN